MFCEQCGSRIEGGPCPFCAAASSPRGWRVGVPGHWGGVWAWLRAGVAAHPVGAGVSVAAAWFQLPVAVLLATIGAITGGIAGTISGTALGRPGMTRLDLFYHWILPLPDGFQARELLPEWAWAIGGPIGGVIGAATGAIQLGWWGLVYPWQRLYNGDPMWPVYAATGQVAAAVAVAVVILAVWLVGERVWLTRGGRARPATPREAEQLNAVAAEAAGRLGLDISRLPQILVASSDDVAAYAGARHVVVSRGLLAKAADDRDELTAVVAHQLVHWARADAVTRTWSLGLAAPLWGLWLISARVTASRRPVNMGLRMLLWPFAVTWRGLVVPVQRRWWARAEAAADEGCAAAGLAATAAQALRYDPCRASPSGWTYQPDIQARQARLGTATTGVGS